MSEDKLLLEKIAAGNGVAFTVMYKRKLVTVQKYIIVLWGSKAQSAEDIVQDIFMKLWEKRTALAGIDYFDGYLFCMVRNRLFNEWRKNDVKQKGMEYLNSRFSGCAESTHDEMQCRYIWKKYTEGVEALPPRARQAYELREKACLSNEEVAEKMGISRSVAKQYSGYAAKKIKAFMALQDAY